MKKIIFALLATVLLMPVANAQTAADSTANSDENRLRQMKLADLEKEKKRVEDQEKFKLKQALNEITEKQNRKEITADEAQKLKLEAAKEAALNIDNKLAIIENQRQLVERGVNYTFQFDGGRTLEIGIGNATDDNGSAMIGLAYQNRRKTVPYDKRTTSDVLFASGLNNTFSGAPLGESPFTLLRSGYAELGLNFKTRLLKDDNFYRLSYGASLQIQSLQLTQNRIFVPNGEQTSFETFPFDLKNTQMRIYNLIFPVYLEFGKSDKRESYDRIRYSTLNHVKYGIGGFAGLNLGNAQFLRYDENGRRIKLQDYRSLNPSTFVYGAGAYVGYGPLALYMSYNFNTLFKNGPIDQNLVSLAARIEL